MSDYVRRLVVAEMGRSLGSKDFQDILASENLEERAAKFWKEKVTFPPSGMSDKVIKAIATEEKISSSWWVLPKTSQKIKFMQKMEAMK